MYLQGFSIATVECFLMLSRAALKFSFRRYKSVRKASLVAVIEYLIDPSDFRMSSYCSGSDLRLEMEENQLTLPKDSPRSPKGLPNAHRKCASSQSRAISQSDKIDFGVGCSESLNSVLNRPNRPDIRTGHKN